MLQNETVFRQTDSFFWEKILLFKSRNAIKVFFSKFKFWIVSSLNHLANIEGILPILNSSHQKSYNGRLRDNQVYCYVNFSNWTFWDNLWALLVPSYFHAYQLISSVIFYAFQSILSMIQRPFRCSSSCPKWIYHWVNVWCSSCMLSLGNTMSM